jgi:hypothetical protein
MGNLSAVQAFAAKKAPERIDGTNAFCNDVVVAVAAAKATSTWQVLCGDSLSDQTNKKTKTNV